MRSSFIAAAVFVALALAATLATTDVWIVTSFWVVAISLLGLWVSHLAAFSLRAATGIRDNTKPGALQMGDSPSQSGVTYGPRRQFLSDLVKAFAFAALATALPSRYALAAPCTITSCSDPKCKCVAPSPVCVTCPARRQVGCAPSNSVPCCTVQAFWICPARHDCYGNGTNSDRCRPWR